MQQQSASCKKSEALGMHAYAKVVSPPSLRVTYNTKGDATAQYQKIRSINHLQCNAHKTGSLKRGESHEVKDSASGTYAHTNGTTVLREN